MTKKLSAYSTTPGSNDVATPNGWPENMAPSDVNNCAREMMARLREFYADSEWIDHGHTIQSSTASTVVVSGDHTATYNAGRAIRVNQSGSQVGRITSSSYLAPNTTINVEGFTVSSPTQVEVGSVSSDKSLPGFGYSNATAGYQKWPSGFILQWGIGQFTGTAGESVTVTLPVTFPSACLFTLAGNTSATGEGGVAAPPNVSSRVVSTSQIRVQQHANVAYSTFYVWIAGGF